MKALLVLLEFFALAIPVAARMRAVAAKYHALEDPTKTNFVGSRFYVCVLLV